MSPYWTSVIDQIIPSTTLWTGGNLISNNIFGRPKYQYRYGCQPVEIIDNLYPAKNGYDRYFMDVVDEYDNEIFSEVNSIGEYKYDGRIYIFPTFEINGVTYSGTTGSTASITTITGLTYVLLSGITNTINSAKLYEPDGSGNAYATISGTTNTISPDYDKVEDLWQTAILNTIEYINNCTDCLYSGNTIDNVGYISSYEPFTGATGITITPIKIRKKLLIGKIFIDNNGEEKIKLTSFKYGPNDCTKNIYVDLTARAFTDTYDCSLGQGSAEWKLSTPTPTPTPTVTPTPLTTSTP
jgi:hypothetical protein